VGRDVILPRLLLPVNPGQLFLTYAFVPFSNTIFEEIITHIFYDLQFIEIWLIWYTYWLKLSFNSREEFDLLVNTFKEKRMRLCFLSLRA
jgi:hypothetical protein